ncbi:hypothetical protein MNBD_ALPHA06-2058 [hydrothermal vent metagenome]|uniref:DNA-damage-inducible protein F n=1 Tax=hydrothermal vent metagenome TaxID=652676 RepID=A0A3B0RD33_9ZZZZ
MSELALSRRQVWSKSWPLIFANGLVPLVGVVDTAVIGLSGNSTQLAGVALGSAVFAIFIWSTYPLRQSTTGLVAQAIGAGNVFESHLVLLRSILLGLCIGALVFLFKQPLSDLAFELLSGSDNAEKSGRQYVAWRFFGTPAAIALFAVTGWMIGAGMARLAMLVQLVLAGTNAALDVWFVIGLGWGPSGVAAGTSIAEWLALALGVWLVLRHVRRTELVAFRMDQVFHLSAFLQLLAVNRDLFIRSLSMVFGFTWFINSGARQGDAILAGNQILLQFITVWAFVLDAFAFTAEAETGRAKGRNSVADLMRAVRFTSEFAVAAALICGGITFVFAPMILPVMIRDPAALQAALEFVPWCAMVPVIGVVAWQLDGIFVGATRSQAMRNSAIVSLLIYLAADFLLAPIFGNTGVWAAFLLYYLARGATLSLAWPALKRAVQSG